MAKQAAPRQATQVTQATESATTEGAIRKKHPGRWAGSKNQPQNLRPPTTLPGKHGNKNNKENTQVRLGAKSAQDKPERAAHLGALQTQMQHFKHP